MKLLAIKDVAGQLGVNRHEVEAWVREEKIETVKLPGKKRVKFRQQGVDLFVKQYITGPKDGPIGPARTRRKGPSRASTKTHRSGSGIERNAWRRPYANR